jgi:hypothetical protein
MRLANALTSSKTRLGELNNVVPVCRHRAMTVILPLNKLTGPKMAPALLKILLIVKSVSNKTEISMLLRRIRSQHPKTIFRLKRM